jgi:hypothetical protein
MATFTAARAASTFPVAKPIGGGISCSAWGVITVSANPVAADIYQICRVPAGAVITGGYIFGGDLDTNATETLDLDFGWADNGIDVADPDGLGNFGPLLTDTVAGVKPEGGIMLPLGGVLITSGPVVLAAETILQFTTIATAATFAAGNLGAVVYYNNP